MTTSVQSTARPKPVASGKFMKLSLFLSLWIIQGYNDIKAVTAVVLSMYYIHNYIIVGSDDYDDDKTVPITMINFRN